MEIVDIFEKPLSKKPTALALGLFDGVHIGHKALLEETVKQAKENGLVPAVFTFRQTEYKKTPTLYPREATYKQMEALGIERIYEAAFEAIASYSPEDFICKIRAVCTPTYLFCGENFHFGRGATGNADTLSRLFSQNGERVVVVPPVTMDGQVVSSSLVREALLEGDIEKANAYLGMPYTLFGEVAHGKALGRKMHFPTINLGFQSNFIVPKRGVYAGFAKIGNRFYPSVSNIGCRPTVETDARDNCETHVLDAEGDFYGQAVEIELLGFLREEIKFESQAALTEQIAKDVETARAWFLAHPTPDVLP